MTTPSSKPEYPPLLPVGLHPKTVEEIRDMCVKAFPLSKTRKKIMDGLEAVINTLSNEKVAAQVWVDGSFLTEKIEHEDSDVVLVIENDVYVNGTAKQKQLIEVISLNLKNTQYLCDSYVHIEYPQGHALYWHGEWMRAYWIRQFGVSRGKEDKGMAVVTVS
jgi:hypothetical protein